MSGIAFQILVERAVTSFRAMSPRFCSIYDPYFWWHERFWKMSAGGFLGLFDGTPMKAVVWRLLGVRMGRRVFDDGCAIPEKTLVHIGDDVALNAGSVLQAHSLEDGAFKSDHIVIGARCHGRSARVRALRGRRARGGGARRRRVPDEGQEVPAHTRWRGNPAAETREPLVAPPTVGTGAPPGPDRHARARGADRAGGVGRRRAGPLAAAGAAGLVPADRGPAPMIR